jgi:hypothetical protein
VGFRDLIAEVDAVVFETLGDIARIEGREEQVSGMFAAPWLQPKFGKLNTGLREPRFEIRVSDSQGLVQGLLISVDLAPRTGCELSKTVRFQARRDHAAKPALYA